MDMTRLTQLSNYAWEVAPSGKMRVPAILYADTHLIENMDDKVLEQLTNVATLPGIVKGAFAMPDAHWGYGFPVGGVAAFDPDQGGIISAGGVGFDISCGVRTMLTGLKSAALEPVKKELAELMFRKIPAGMGKWGEIRLNSEEMNAMLRGGAQWAVARGWGESDDLARMEENGCMKNAQPDHVSDAARKRQRNEMGTLGSGNHYCEIQIVDEIFAPEIAKVYGINKSDVVVTIHCGSRGMGHQIGTEFLREMALSAPVYGIDLPDRELACVPINSDIGQRYLGAMRAAINCALANREIIGHLMREVFAALLPEAKLKLLFDVSHNTCKAEMHKINGVVKEVYIHRKGATRAFGPGHPDLPEALRATGQPVLIGGSMGTESWILAGVAESEERSFSSACHGAGRAMSRHAATKQWSGRQITDQLSARGILIRSPSLRGVAEEAPDAYKKVGEVVEATEKAGLARKVARLKPIICVKG